MSAIRVPHIYSSSPTPRKSTIDVKTLETMKSKRVFQGVSAGDRSRKVLEWFVKFTSVGGFTQARDSDNKLSTLIWTILFLAGLTLTIWGIVGLVISFCEYNSITNIELGHKSSGMVFPAVAVCNQNRIHCGHLYDKIILCSQV